MFPVVAAATMAWLLLFIVLLAAPPGRRGIDRRGPDRAYSGDESPAVVSLLGGQLSRYGFGATLVDLAGRGWFRMSPAGMTAGSGEQAGAWELTRRSGAWGPPGPVMCVVCTEPPAERLTAYERRVVAHVGLRAGARGEVPGPALSEGFEGGETEFMKAFGEEVDADARERGLTRSRLSPGRIALLCALLLVPAANLLFAIDPAHRKGAVVYLGLSCFVAFGLTVKIGTSRRCTAAGRAARQKWHAAAARTPGASTSVAWAPGGGGRLAAYAVALGVAPAAAAAFAPAGKDVLWSSYRGSWQQIAVEKNTWPWPRAIVTILAIIFAPVLYFAGVIWLFADGMAGLAERVIGLTVVAAIGLAAWAASRTAFPRFAELDGQVIRQSFVKGSDDSPDEYHVVIDDGVRATAWDFTVGSVPYRRLTPGTFVHVRVNLRSQRQVSVEPVEPPAVARPLADIAAEQQRAANDGLPNPADLVPADDAAYVLGAQVIGEHIANPAGQTMTWQPTGKDQPVLTVIVRHATAPLGGRPMRPGARPVPWVADGYLLDGRGWLHVGSLMMIIGIRGTAAAGNEASLVWLMPRAEARLRELLSEGSSDMRSELLILINIDASS
jgi:hypothetical protein